MQAKQATAPIDVMFADVKSCCAVRCCVVLCCVVLCQFELVDVPWCDVTLVCFAFARSADSSECPALTAAYDFSCVLVPFTVAVLSVVCLLVYLFIYLFVYLFIYLVVCLFPY